MEEKKEGCRYPPTRQERAALNKLTMPRADVEAPKALVERLIGQIGPLRESGRLRQAFEKQMGYVEAEA